MAKSTRKERREARRLERILARTSKPRQASGVSFKTITSLQILPGKVTVLGTIEDGSSMSASLSFTEPNHPTKYRRNPL